jgi:hypothetical protein
MGQKVQGSFFSSAARDAPELAALQGLVAAKQRAAKLWSHSKATRNKAPEPQQNNAQQSKAQQSNVQQSKAQQSSGAWLRSLLRCGKATRSKATRSKLRSLAPELAATQRAAKLRSLAPKLAALRQSNAAAKQASKKMKKGSCLFVCAPAAPAPQPPEVSGALAME